jgi:hypothetical protein
MNLLGIRMRGDERVQDVRHLLILKRRDSEEQVDSYHPDQSNHRVYVARLITITSFIHRH